MLVTNFFEYYKDLCLSFSYKRTTFFIKILHKIYFPFSETDMEILEQHLEEKFIAKIIYIMKGPNLSKKHQYEIVNIFKNKCTSEIIDLTDDTKLELYHTICSINRNMILTNSKEVQKPITNRTFLKFCETYRQILKKQIEEQEDLYYLDMDLYRDWMDLYRDCQRNKIINQN